MRPLSTLQERKLVDYLEGNLLEITRNFKKRSQPSSSLQTLSSYLTAARPLLPLILQIPPLNPSASLRTSLLLRLTGEVMSVIPGYAPDVETFPQLLSWLDDLDKGWLAVLRGQVWDPTERMGVELSAPLEDSTLRAAPVSQTDRTRLRSILIAGTSKMEEWMTGADVADQTYQSVLETYGLQQGFNDLFSRTLAEMGSLDGSISDPTGMDGTC